VPVARIRAGALFCFRRRSCYRAASITEASEASEASEGTIMISYRGLNITGAEGGSKKSGAEYPGVVNKDYTWPGSKDLNLWLTRKASIIRYCVAWERCQPVLGGALTNGATAALDSMAKLTGDNGTLFLIDVHNYGRRQEADGVGYQIDTSGKVTIAHYADFIGKLAARYKDTPNVAIGLMNEPHDLHWADGSSAAVGLGKMYQAAIDAARKAGFKGFLTVCPANWGKVSGLDSEMGTVLAGLKDPLNKVVLEAHQYVDNGEEGNDASIINNDPNIFAKKLAKGTDWTKKYHRPIMLGEFGIPKTDLGVTVETNLVKYLEDSGWWGYTIWADGPWWSDSYYYNVGDINGIQSVVVPPLKLGTDFPGGGTGGGGGGDSGLEARVAKLETDVSTLKDAVLKLDARLDKIATGATG
jgi:endoglucanase